jgi:hypothetical protein
MATAEAKAAMAAAAMMPARGPAAFVGFTMSMHFSSSPLVEDISLDSSWRAITQDISFDNLIIRKLAQYQYLVRLSWWWVTLILAGGFR